MATLPTLLLSREAQALGSDRQLRRQREGGLLLRLATGVYVNRREFDSLDRDGQHLTRVHAAALLSGLEEQFSHDSAAALWRLPSIGPWPLVTHQVVERQAGGRSRAAIRRHGIGFDPHAEVVDGVLVTSLARTVIDMATVTPFVRAVAMADRAMAAGTSHADFVRAIESRTSTQGRERAHRVIDFASGKAESAGESLARVQFHALGYPPPELQVEFADSEGSIGHVDFYWPELDLIVEFDGQSKYGPNRQFQRSISLEQILLGEKAREDRLRRLVHGFARITWSRTVDRRALADQLRPHGLVERARARRDTRAPLSDG